MLGKSINIIEMDIQKVEKELSNLNPELIDKLRENDSLTILKEPIITYCASN